MDEPYNGRSCWRMPSEVTRQGCGVQPAIVRLRWSGYDVGGPWDLRNWMGSMCWTLPCCCSTGNRMGITRILPLGCFKTARDRIGAGVALGGEETLLRAVQNCGRVSVRLEKIV